MSKITKNQAKKAINTICKAALLNYFLLDELDEGLTLELLETANALRQHTGLDDYLVDDFEQWVQDEPEDILSIEIPYADGGRARAIVYNMCKECPDSEDISRHLDHMQDMMYLLNPDKKLRRLRRIFPK